MEKMKYIYGPVPSRRLGASLGVSPIPKKTCNYSCIYCQLGRTDHMTNTRQMFFDLDDIMAEFDEMMRRKLSFDAVTIVGEGEPTLYLGLGELIEEIKSRTDKPVAVITNGALLYDRGVQNDLLKADIVMPTLDAFDEASLRKINRPIGTLNFSDVLRGLREFSSIYDGHLWIEIMLIEGINDDALALEKYREILAGLRYERVFINTPVRPPAESFARAVGHDVMERAVSVLGGVSIELLCSSGFHSEITDHYEAILSIIKRHPMNRFEIDSFLAARGCSDAGRIISGLEGDGRVETIEYRGLRTYRLK